MVTPLDNNLTPSRLLSDPFPPGLPPPPPRGPRLLPPVAQSLTPGRAAGQGVPNFLHAVSQQFSMGFQFALPGHVSVETSYVGSISQRLTMTRNVNQYPDQFLSLRNRLNAQAPNPFAGVITDPTSALSLPTA